MDLSKVLNIISMMPQKKQKAILALAVFGSRPSKDVWLDIIDATIAFANQKDKEILSVFRMMPISDNIIEDTFGGMIDKTQPLTFTEDHIDYIRNNIYRNRAGKYRIIPQSHNVTADDMPLDGLETDEEIIDNKLTVTRKTNLGTVEIFEGFRALKQQHYEGPYEGVYATLQPNIQRINIISSFEPSDPAGFFMRGTNMYRNMAHKMTVVDAKYVSEESLQRAFLLMYLVAGANEANWRTLYALLHYMVRCPNSATGYIIYLNDFDAGGNGKSKFVAMLQGMFGDSFTAFEPHQLRFNLSLMGRRLVHISEYEANDTSKQLLGMLKAMTGRDKFQYEGKGMDPIVAETYQNFIISSNKYVYFDDAGIKRRLQNFHCSNFLHLLLVKYYKSSKYLNKLFGNNLTGESYGVLRGMAHSLLDYIYKDDTIYDIPLRPQSIVLGSLKNPILRVLFGERFNPETCIRDEGSGSVMDLLRIEAEAQPEQYNYAANMVTQWLSNLNLSVSRDALTIRSELPAETFMTRLRERILELDQLSIGLKSKGSVFMEDATLGKYNALEILSNFFEMKDLSVEKTHNGVIIK